MLTQVVSAGLVTGLAAGGCAYAARWPTSQIFGRTVLSGSDSREIALTFDDGPNGEYTQCLLELLATYHVRATFFLVGQYVRQAPAVVRAVVAAGHLVGNHTMTHPSLFWERSARVREEIADCSTAIEDATGKAVKWFRPPFGARRPDVLRIVRELGLTPAMWNVTAHDWDATDADELAARTLRGIDRNRRRHRGSNILLHDGGHLQIGVDRSVTLAATRKLLESCAGFRFVTLDAWI